MGGEKAAVYISFRPSILVAEFHTNSATKALVTNGNHDELRLAPMAIKIASAPSRRIPEVIPRTSQIQVCICASR
jgi:hypothetical protein